MQISEKYFKVLYYIVGGIEMLKFYNYGANLFLTLIHKNKQTNKQKQSKKSKSRLVDKVSLLLINMEVTTFFWMVTKVL